jgi:hypothetical protein
MKALWILAFVGYCLSLGCSPQKQNVKTGNIGNYYGPLVDTILYHSGRQFVQREQDGISFYYEDSPFFKQNIEKLIKDALTSKQRCVDLLRIKTPNYPLKVIYFKDREALRPYLHFAPKGIALPDAYTLLIATNDSLRAYHTHELMHIVSISHYGGYAATPPDWIQEGVAVYADSPCLGYPIHTIAAYLHHTQQMPPMDTLFQRFRTLPDMAAYMYAGSVVQYILDQYGASVFEQLWKQGVGHLPAVLGKDQATFEAEYKAFLMKTYPQKPNVNWELLDKKGCG